MGLPTKPLALGRWLAVAAAVDLALVVLVAAFAAKSGWAILAVILLAGGAVAFAAGAWRQLRRAVAERELAGYKLQTELTRAKIEARQSTACHELMRRADAQGATPNAVRISAVGRTTTTERILPSCSTSKV